MPEIGLENATLGDPGEFDLGTVGRAVLHRVPRVAGRMDVAAAGKVEEVGEGLSLSRYYFGRTEPSSGVFHTR